MPTKKYKQKLMKHRICVGARIISCATFLVLALIGVSSLVRAMSLESVANQNGIPSAWKTASLGRPESITVPITYWDQRQDDCTDENRQFEWTICQYWTAGALQGVVKDTLGRDGLPVPTYTNSTDAWAANHDVFTANVTGHDPVRTTDNFYRWFHNTEVSEQYNRQLTFTRVGDSNTYTYGGQNIFPLDGVDFSNGDTASNTGNSDDGKQHNFHFTAHMSIPMKIAADGTEVFEFSGDDDVWVFLNGHLVLDIGGLHEALNGNFRINTDGTITTYVQNVNDVSDREKLGKPGVWAYNYVNQLNEHNRSTYADKTETINIGLKAGDVVNLDFFYAERSTTASNTKITISNMNWPISADSDVTGKIIGQKEDTKTNLVEYQSSVKNRDPQNSLTLERLSSYIKDSATSGDETYNNSGFLPLDLKTLMYTTTPDDADSWKAVDITPPMNSDDGFILKNPITMQPAGKEGDTLYFRYFAETYPYTGDITNVVAYYTNNNGVAGVTYDQTTIPYVGEQPAVKYTVTVNYEIDFGNEEPDGSIITPSPYREEVEDGNTYNIITPELDGFTPDREVVSGKVEGKDVVETVIYKKNPPEELPKPKYPVIIKYIKTDTGEEAFPEYSAEHETGTSFSIYPKDLDGYTKDRTEVKIEVGDGPIEEIVYYTPVTKPPVNPDPVDPDPIDPNPVDPSPVDPTPSNPDPVDPTPSNPTTPDTPTDILPTIPVIPSDNGDELIFYAPLGEVAYVPNTGVISDFVAPIFEQYFAEVVLSQAFILVVLLIFSGSFATYFSLRQYANLTVATRTTPVKKMPKNIANSKTARQMQKAAAKTAKKTTSSKTVSSKSTTSKTRK